MKKRKQKELLINCSTQRISRLLLKMFKNRILTEDNLCFSKNTVRQIMKEKWNLRFSRCKSRPNNADLQKLKFSRSLFSVKFSQMLDKKSLIINIEESCISRNTKIDYAWNKKGDVKEYNNSPFIGSVSLILAILSNGTWIAMIVNSSINSELFWEFIRYIKKKNWILMHKNCGFDKVIITLDNWPWHRSRLTRWMLEGLNCSVVYLPAYSPA